MKVILVALDLEAQGDNVLARAAQLAMTHAARLVLLHVIEKETLSYVIGASGRSKTDLQKELRRQTLARLETFLSEIGRTRRSSSRVEFGSPYEVVTRVAREVSASLTVIGPGKKQTLKEKVLGSTADRVIRTSLAPVLVVKRRSVKPYTQVVAAVDFSPQSAVAAKTARKLAPEAQITLIHVDDIPPIAEQAMLRSGTSQAAMEEYRSVRIARAGRDLARLARDVAGPGKAHVRNLQGVPGTVLARLSRSKRVDLLALGPYGRNAVLRALLGSVTQQVLREAECDVLVAGAR